MQQRVLTSGRTVVGTLVDKQQQGTDSAVTVEVFLGGSESVRRSTSEFISMTEYVTLKSKRGT